MIISIGRSKVRIAIFKKITPIHRNMSMLQLIKVVLPCFDQLVRVSCLHTKCPLVESFNSYKMATKEEHDDLEYHVTFPTPTPGSDQIEGFEIIEGILAKRETAVMMVGWMACEDKYLSKYSKVYEEKG